jgi:hypothetical protein
VQLPILTINNDPILIKWLHAKFYIGRIVMQISAQDLMMRYLDRYAKSWPEEIRAEERNKLEHEVQELYQTKLAQGIHEFKAVEDVLNELGDPRELAAKKAGKSKGLLKGVYYKSFVRTLPAILWATIAIYLIISIAFFAVTLNSCMEKIVFLREYDIVEATMYASLITFIVYLVMDKTQIPIKGQEWTVADLMPSQTDKNRISRVKTVLSLLINAFAMILLMYLPELLVRIASVSASGFISEVLVQANPNWQGLWPWIMIFFSVIILESIVRLVHPRWDKLIFAANIVTNLLAFGSAALFFFNVVKIAVIKSYLDAMNQKVSAITVIGLFAIVLILDTWTVYQRTLTDD